MSVRNESVLYPSLVFVYIVFYPDYRLCNLADIPGDDETYKSVSTVLLDTFGRVSCFVPWNAGWRADFNKYGILYDVFYLGNDRRPGGEKDRRPCLRDTGYLDLCGQCFYSEYERHWKCGNADFNILLLRIRWRSTDDPWLVFTGKIAGG